MNEAGWVVVARANSVHQASAIRMRLAGVGLDVQIWDEHVTTQQPWLVTALGGVRVCVPFDQVDEANRVLAGSDVPPEISKEELEQQALSAKPEVSHEAQLPALEVSSKDITVVVLVMLFVIVIGLGLIRFSR